MPPNKATCSPGLVYLRPETKSFMTVLNGVDRSLGMLTEAEAEGTLDKIMRELM